MAQRVQIHMIDDLTGEEAQETVRFGLEGIEYEIDLTTKNAVALRTALSEYVEKGRKASSGRKGRNSSGGAAGGAARRDEVQQIRQWAEANGHKVSSRGRIAQSIVDAYNKAS